MSVFCPNCMAEVEDGASRCPSCGGDTSVQNKPHQLPTDTILNGRYIVGKSIGEGGFGITYVGYDLKLRAKVAIKEYFPAGSVTRTAETTVYAMDTSPESAFALGKAKFVAESQVLAQFLDEPNIVSVRDYFEENNTAYIVMEFLEGKSLHQVLKERGRLSMAEALEMTEPLMTALQKIHAHGLIHRDISPANIMQLPDGRIKLLDFGAARQYTDSEKSLSIILKPGYAPEEQYNKRGDQGPWSDVYALCATIYKMITGVTPDNAVDRMFGTELKKPSELGVDITPAQEAVLMKGLAVKSADRIRSMDELRRAFAGEIEIAEPDTAGHGKASAKETAKPKKKKTVLVAAAALAVAAVAAVLVLTKGGTPESAAVPEPTEASAEAEAESIETAATVTPKPTPEPTPEPAVVLQSGEAGNAVAWQFDSQGVLTFSGTGAMYNYNDTGYTAPWREFKDEIKKVVIEDGVTTVGEYAFADCTNLEEAELSDAVTQIGARSFSECTSLKGIDIPDGVDDVGGAAFYDCGAIEQVTLGNSVRKIRGYAFFRCAGFDHIELPKSLTDIEEYAFYGCSALESILYDGTPNDWMKVTVGDGNYPFKDTQIGTLS